MIALISTTSRGFPWWSVAASAVATAATFAVALEAMRATRLTAWDPVRSTERTVMVPLAAPARPAAPPVARPVRAVRPATGVAPRPAREAARTPAVRPVDTAASPIVVPAPAPVPMPEPPVAEAAVTAPAAAPPAPRAGLASTSVHFLGLSLLDPAARDSMVAALERGRAGTARERARDVMAPVIQEEWRRWAAVRASSDRLRPAPAVGQVWDRPGSSLGATGGISVPLLSRGPSRAQRQRDSVVHAENLERLRRIEARIRARRDSLEAGP